MNSLPTTHRPPVGFGMTSLVIGTVGLMLSVFPVLGMPLSAFGLLCGVIGLFLALPSGGFELRWSLAGIAICAAVLAINIAIAYAPAGYLPRPDVPQYWQQVPDRPYVPPPG